MLDRASLCRRLRLLRVGVILAPALVSLGVLGGPAHANLPSNDDGLIAFQRNDDAHGQIWVMDPTAQSPESTAVQVPTGPEPVARPAYGPTRGLSPGVTVPKWALAYQRLANGNWDIWSRTTHGTAGEQPQFDAGAALVEGPGNQTEPTYSTYGGEPLLAYVSDQTGHREIWLRDATGVPKQLTADGGDDANPDFAGRFRPLDSDNDGITYGPNDNSMVGLAFESTRGGRRAIWALDVEVNHAGEYVTTHDLREVISGPEDLFEPSWQLTKPFDAVDPSVPPMPNDRVNDILFTTMQSGTSYLDYVQQPWAENPSGTVTPAVPFADPSTISRFALTGNPGGDRGAIWAPDGDRVAFERTDAGNTDVWSVAADGSDLRRLTSSAGLDLHPSWQPATEPTVDKVGGHTNPGPVSRGRIAPAPGGGNPSQTPPGTGAHHAPSSPQLAIGSARWHAGKIRVRGRTAPKLQGRLRVTFKCGRSAAQRRVRLASSHTGQFSATLRAPRGCRRARRGTIVVAYGGDNIYAPGQAIRAVHRR